MSKRQKRTRVDKKTDINDDHGYDSYEYDQESDFDIDGNLLIDRIEYEKRIKSNQEREKRWNANIPVMTAEQLAARNEITAIRRADETARGLWSPGTFPPLKPPVTAIGKVYAANLAKKRARQNSTLKLEFIDT